jgi:hypothetical protein
MEALIDRLIANVIPFDSADVLHRAGIICLICTLKMNPEED